MAPALPPTAHCIMQGIILQPFALLATASLPCPAPPADYFPFLSDPSNLRNRTTFYHTLARLLFMEDTPAKFKSFVAPLQQVRHRRSVPQQAACTAAGCLYRSRCAAAGPRSPEPCLYRSRLPVPQQAACTEAGQQADCCCACCVCRTIASVLRGQLTGACLHVLSATWADAPQGSFWQGR